MNDAQLPTCCSACAASIYSGYEVDDDWCVSVLQSYQTEGDALFPWSVGKFTAVQASHLAAVDLGAGFVFFASAHTASRLSRRGHDSGREAAAGTFPGESDAHALRSGT